MWEMWYGIDVVKYIQMQLFEILQSVIKGGFCFFLLLENKLFVDWMDLIKCCWDIDLKNWLEVDEVWIFFDNFL